jgi:hypothetical protein
MTLDVWSRMSFRVIDHPRRRVSEGTVRRLMTAMSMVLVMMGATSSITRGAEDCPASVITFATHFHIDYPHVLAPAFDTTLVSTSGDTSRVGFDRTTAHLSLNALGGVWVGERVLERFDVTGVPVGTVVQATVLLRLNGEVFSAGGVGGGDANFTATIATAADSVLLDATVPGPCYGCTKPVHTTIALPVAITAGTPSEIAFDLL